jgi:ribonuclease Z
MPFDITVLGCASATPTSTRHPSAQLVNLLGRFFLIDCGEGTQMQLRKNKIKIQKINFICISHLHGDHYLGLIGLLSTMNLLGRKKTLTIFAPKGLDKIIELHFKLSYSKLSYELKIINLQGSKLRTLYEDEACQLLSFGLKHRVPCWGFKLMEKQRPRKILKTMIEKYSIPLNSINDIKSGADYLTNENELIKNTLLTTSSYSPRSYAYCSDTQYFDSLVNYIEEVDLLYHEATFHSNLSNKAKSTFHSTSQDAAKVAFEGNVKKLLIGHFSSRYKDLDILKKDAAKIFSNVELAIEGKKFKIKKHIKS